MSPATNARIRDFGISAQALKAGSAPAYAGWTLEVEAPARSVHSAPGAWRRPRTARGMAVRGAADNLVTFAHV
jgi:hypothetical protein